MVTKGIVEKIIDRNHIKVRLPVYDKIEGVSTATLTDDLSDAITCTLPNIHITYSVGDIVFVSFEDNDINQPVIIGLLDIHSKNNHSLDIISTSLDVQSIAKLPFETSIGYVESKEIEALRGVRDNIQTQLDYISTHGGSGGGTTYTLGTSGNDITLKDNSTQQAQSITAPYATKALKDSDGNQINSTYAKTSTLATVATSGSYNDLLNKPTITDTHYTLSTSGNDVILTPSVGDVQSITVPYVVG